MSIRRSQALQRVPKSTPVPNRPEESRAPGPPPAASGLRYSFANTEVAPSTQVQRVLSAPGRPTAGNAAVVAMLQRQADEDRQASAPDPGAACRHVLGTPGRPMDDTLRTEMEARLGADFRDVRMHTDTVAQRSAEGIGANAYTSRHHVVIGPGGVDKHTLAHELTHVIQQRRGPVSGTDTGGGVRVSDPSDRFEREAEANAHRVMSGATPVQREVTGAAPGAPAGPVVVQRDAQEDLEIGDFTGRVSLHYQNQAFHALGRYRKYIGDLKKNWQYEEQVNYMAKGYRAWNENYYNKTQAYLFEAQKVSEATREGRRTSAGFQNSLAYLGSDTDKEPDITVFHEDYTEGKFGRFTYNGQRIEAVEIKASTTPLPESVNGRLADGLAQLKKREDTGKFSYLTLELHMDNEKNCWPFTAHEFSTRFGGDFTKITIKQWNDRITQRVGDLKKTKKINLPLNVRAYYGGSAEPYAQVHVP